jgi:hypothetical protein
MNLSTKLLIITLLNQLCSLQSITGNDVFGCGGFIKTSNSEIDIDFSLVEVKL